MEYCKILSECFQKLPKHTPSDEHRFVSSILQCLVTHLARTGTTSGEPIQENVSSNSLVETKHNKLEIEEGEMVNITGEVVKVTDDTPKLTKKDQSEKSTQIEENGNRQIKIHVEGIKDLDNTNYFATVGAHVHKSQSKPVFEEIAATNSIDIKGIKPEPNFIEENNTLKDKVMICKDEIDQNKIDACTSLNEEHLDTPQTSPSKHAIGVFGATNTTDRMGIKKLPKLVEGNILTQADTEPTTKITLTEESTAVTSINRT